MSGKSFSREFKLAAIGQIEAGEKIAASSARFGRLLQDPVPVA